MHSPEHLQGELALLPYSSLGARVVCDFCVVCVAVLPVLCVSCCVTCGVCLAVSPVVVCVAHMCVAVSPVVACVCVCVSPVVCVLLCHLWLWCVYPMLCAVCVLCADL